MRNSLKENMSRSVLIGIGPISLTNKVINTMNKKMKLFAVMLSVLATTAVVSGMTLAATSSDTNATSPGPQRQDRIRNDIATNDYNSWSTDMTQKVADMRQRATDLESKINQDTFDKLKQAHDLMQSGDKAGAQKIFDELGIGGPRRGMMGFRGHFHAPQPDTTTQSN